MVKESTSYGHTSLGKADASDLVAPSLLSAEQLTFLDETTILPVEVPQSFKTDFYSVGEPLSSFLDCTSEDFYSPTSDLNPSQSTKPIEYMTVNLKIAQADIERKSQDDTPQRNCFCYIQ